jgi:hypothetical protein
MATAPPQEGTPEAEKLHKEYLAKWHNILREEARRQGMREGDVKASLGMNISDSRDPTNPLHFGGRKSRRHANKSRRHAKKSRRHAKKSRR